MTKNTPRALLLDIDGTMLDNSREGHSFVGKALQEVFGTTGSIEDFDTHGKTDWYIMTTLMRQAGVDEAAIVAKREEAFRAYARCLGEAIHTLNMVPMPGVLHLLDGLKDNPEFVLGIITGNVYDVVPIKLRAAGLDPAIFRFGAYGSDHPDRNALPMIALSRIAQERGYTVPTDRAMVVGDTPLDIACARHAGLKVLSVATGIYDHQTLAGHQPDYLLDDLSNTEAVMQILTHF